MSFFSLINPMKSALPLVPFHRVQFHARGLHGTLHFSFDVQSFNDNGCIPTQDRSWYVAKKVPFSPLDAFYPRSSCDPHARLSPRHLWLLFYCTVSLIVTWVIIAIIPGCPEVTFTRLSETLLRRRKAGGGILACSSHAEMT